MITEQDKQKVIERVAQGKTYREAIKGTKVKSVATVKNIVYSEPNKIEQKKQTFAELLEKKAELRDEKLAEHLIKGLNATKRFNSEIVDEDFNNKHKFLNTVLQLKGHLQQNPLGVQVNNFLVERSDSIELE